MPVYTYNDVRKHNRNGGCWLIIHGKVYDVASFTDHPGTHQKLISAARTGGDATDNFEKVSQHLQDPRVEPKLQHYCKGDMNMSTVPVRRTYIPEVKMAPVNLSGNANNFPWDSSHNLPGNDGTYPMGPAYMPNSEQQQQGQSNESNRPGDSTPKITDWHIFWFFVLPFALLLYIKNK